MSGKTFNMAEPVVAEVYSNFSNVENGLSMFSQFEKLPCSSNFSQSSQAFPLASFEFIKLSKGSSTNSAYSAFSNNVQI